MGLKIFLELVTLTHMVSNPKKIFKPKSQVTETTVIQLIMEAEFWSGVGSVPVGGEQSFDKWVDWRREASVNTETWLSTYNQPRFQIELK